MADAYLQTRSDQAATSIDNVIERSRARIDDYRQQLTSAIERLASAPPGSSGAAEASADQQILNLQISSLLTRISSLEGIDTSGGVVLNPASKTAVTVQPSRTNVLMTGAGAGLILGVVVAFALRSRNKTVRSSGDIGRELGIESLGILKNEGAAPIVATITQRVLRLLSVNDARVVALVFDEASPWSSSFIDRLAAKIRVSGTPVVVSKTSQPGTAESELVLIPVAPDASEAARLRALRVSDAAVLVASIGASRLKSLAKVSAEAREMGTSVIGAVLVSGQLKKGLLAGGNGSDSAEDVHSAAPEGSSHGSDV